MSLYRDTIPHFLLANYIRAVITGRGTSKSVIHNARVLNQIEINFIKYLVLVMTETALTT